MRLAQQVAKHFRDAHFGGNWTWVNLKDTLEGVTVAQATTRLPDMNTILTLVYHMYYYVVEVKKVLEGGPLTSKDEYSFNHPDIKTQAEWDELLASYWKEVEAFAALIELLPDETFHQTFSDDKYGTYYRNLAGMIEHTHYHTGQIVMIKKLL